MFVQKIGSIKNYLDKDKFLHKFKLSSLYNPVVIRKTFIAHSGIGKSNSESITHLNFQRTIFS